MDTDSTIPIYLSHCNETFFFALMELECVLTPLRMSDYLVTCAEQQNAIETIHYGNF